MILVALQILAVIVLAPLLQGWIKWLKARLQGRAGPSVWQPYRDLRKLWAKEAVWSSSSSAISRVGPFLLCGLAVTASAMLPVADSSSAWLAGSSIFAFLSVLALSRFATVLVGMDSGSAFAGMAAGRDLLFSLLVEPTAFLALLAIGLPTASNTFQGIITRQQTTGATHLPVTVLVLCILLIVAVTETGRLPVDNPDTHLELTMVHEGMLLELTGRQLAAAVWSAQVRQLLWFTLLADVCLPFGVIHHAGIWPLAAGLLLWAAKCFALGALVAALESGSAKLRIFAVPRLLSFALALAVVAVLADTVF